MLHYDVLICTPGFSMWGGYVRALMDTVERMNEEGISYKWLTAASSLVHNTREVLLSGDGRMDINDTGPMHGKVSYNTMVWIDSDIVWTWEQFKALLDTHHEVLTGAYLLANRTTSSIHTEEYPQGIPKDVILGWKGREPMRVAGCGFGFLGVKRGVFERVEKPWFGMLSQILMDNQGRQHHVTVGEDLSWCSRAAQAGVSIYFDPNILVRHLKTLPVEW